MKKKNWFLKRLWRLQFKKNIRKFSSTFDEGKCTHCDAGKFIGLDEPECSLYYCPCKGNEELKRIFTLIKYKYI